MADLQAACRSGSSRSTRRRHSRYALDMNPAAAAEASSTKYARWARRAHAGQLLRPYRRGVSSGGASRRRPVRTATTGDLSTRPASSSTAHADCAAVDSPAPASVNPFSKTHSRVSARSASPEAIQSMTARGVAGQPPCGGRGEQVRQPVEPARDLPMPTWRRAATASTDGGTVQPAADAGDRAVSRSVAVGRVPRPPSGSAPLPRAGSVRRPGRAPASGP